ACAPTMLQTDAKPRPSPRRLFLAAVAWGKPRLEALLAQARASYAWLREKTPPRARPALPWGIGALGALLVFGPVLLVLLSGPKKVEDTSAQAPAPARDDGLSDERLRAASAAGAASLEQLAREFPNDARVQRELVRVHTSEEHGAAAMRAL